MKIWYGALWMLLCFFAFSCNQGGETVKTDSAYKFFNLERAGWKSKAISQYFSGMGYTATLVPIQYYLIKEKGFDNPSEIDSLYEAYKTERVIEMEFRHDSKDDLLKKAYTGRNYEASVKYMAFSMSKDFMAVTKSGDTVQCSGAVFERNFKLAPYKKLLLHFGGIPEDEQIQLVYQDQLFGNGIIKFKFTETPLKL